MAEFVATGLVLIVVSVFTACVSDKELVTDTLAARHYHDLRYQRECVGSAAPPTTCPAFRAAVNETLAEVTVCNETQKIGKLPPMARKRLKALRKKLEAQP